MSLTRRTLLGPAPTMPARNAATSSVELWAPIVLMLSKAQGKWSTVRCLTHQTVKVPEQADGDALAAALAPFVAAMLPQAQPFRNKGGAIASNGFRGGGGSDAPAHGPNASAARALRPNLATAAPPRAAANALQEADAAAQRVVDAVAAAQAAAGPGLAVGRCQVR